MPIPTASLCHWFSPPAPASWEGEYQPIVRGAFQNCHLGYWIAAGFEGQGLMKKAVAATVAIVRDELGLHRIEAGTLVHNVASQRVLLANGFEQFGLAPKYLKINGRWQDHRMFQLLLHN
ncbi:MAG: GNAT family protein [Tessaracoccus sp.]